MQVEPTDESFLAAAKFAADGKFDAYVRYAAMPPDEIDCAAITNAIALICAVSAADPSLTRPRPPIWSPHTHIPRGCEPILMRRSVWL